MGIRAYYAGGASSFWNSPWKGVGKILEGEGYRWPKKYESLFAGTICFCFALGWFLRLSLALGITFKTDLLRWDFF